MTDNTPLTPEQQARLNEATKTYHSVQNQDFHRLTPAEMYQAGIGQMREKTQDDQKMIDPNLDVKVTKTMMKNGFEQEKMPEVIAKHSPTAANLSSTDQRVYGEHVTAHAHKSLEQEQNERPERSDRNTHAPKPSEHFTQQEAMMRYYEQEHGR